MVDDGENVVLLCPLVDSSAVLPIYRRWKPVQRPDVEALVSLRLQEAGQVQAGAS